MTGFSDSGDCLDRNFDSHRWMVDLLADIPSPEQLVYELIQNADDSTDATRAEFTFTDDELTVTNDGSFTKCSDLAVPFSDCDYGDENQHCDFHRIRRIQNAEKTMERETTGAFGIGFNSVYRLTDSPELISAGIHWKLEDWRDERQVRRCTGDCDRDCKSASGTTFVLAWATEAESEGRTAFEQPPITRARIDEYEAAALAGGPQALLFNQNLTKISVVTRDGTRNVFTKTVFTTTVADDTVTIDLPNATQRWRKFSGDFVDQAASLRDNFPEVFKGRVEKSSTVEVAIREDESDTDGRVHVTFPTQQWTHLPLHINADVFPDKGRLRLRTEQERGQWNKAAMARAGQVIADYIIEIRRALDSPFRFWDLVNSSWEVRDRAEDELGLTSYWHDYLLDALLPEEVIWSNSEEWLTPDAVRSRRIEQDDEAVATGDDEAVTVLGGLGINTVHHQIQQNTDDDLLEELGVAKLEISDVTEALTKLGVADSSATGNIETSVGGKDALSVLWQECNRLLGPDRRGAGLREVALWPATDGSYLPATKMWRAAEDDEETQLLVQALGLDVAFLGDTMAADLDRLRRLVYEPSLEDMVLALESLIEGNEGQPVEIAREDRKALFRWLLDRKNEIEGDPSLKDRLRALPLYPSGSGPRSLERAFLPSKFRDPLNHALIVDTAGLGNAERLLKVLEVDELDLKTYCTSFLPGLFEKGDVDADQRKKLVRELAKHLDEIRQDDLVRDALRLLPIVECACDEPTFLAADQVYFESDIITAVLGGQAPVTIEPEEDNVRELLNELGVETNPRPSDVVEAARGLSQLPRRTDALSQMEAILTFLATAWPADDPDEEHSLESSHLVVWEPLMELEWLPRESSSEWFTPRELNAGIERHLFESTGIFLDCPRKVQSDARKPLHWLGVQIQPKIDNVVDHLLHCAESNDRVDIKVYKFLNDQVKSAGNDASGNPFGPPALTKLHRRTCLLNSFGSEVTKVGDAGPMYLAPPHAYLADPGLGRYRHQLADEYQKHRELLTALGVKESPDAEDAEALLEEIAGSHEPDEPLGVDDKKIVEKCWQILHEALHKADVSAGDHDRGALDSIFSRIGEKPTFPDRRQVLRRPDRLVLDNSPKRSEYLLDDARSSLVEPHEDHERALREAGIKSLTHSLKFVVVNDDDLEPDDDFAERLEERERLLARVFVSFQVPNARDVVSDFVKQVEVDKASELMARLEISDVFNQDEPVAVKAVLENPNDREWNLRFAHGDDSIPWSHIAAEMIGGLTALQPKDALPQVEAVLELRPEIAARRLDGWEIPELPDDRTEGVQSPVAALIGLDDPDVDEVGIDAGLDRELDADVLVESDLEGNSSGVGPVGGAIADEPEDLAGEAVGETSGQTAETRRPRPSGRLRKPGEPTGSSRVDRGRDTSLSDVAQEPDIDGSSAERTSDEEDEGRYQASAPGVQASGASSTGRPRREPRPASPEGGRMQGLSYVEASHTTQRSDETTSREVGNRGEEVVVAYEIEQGRDASRMENPNNEGYDIESLANGEVERYIEVKTTEGAWGKRGVYLTAPQLRHAREKGPRYWLYVVEFLGDEKERIYRIKNPARWIDRFVFDGSWKDAAEVEVDNS
ncbi:MAG: hypothetical protein CL471_14405 [Acidobacteria bacterium]|nr:hypothetical protein [Acidobacteriota bacterium]